MKAESYSFALFKKHGSLWLLLFVEALLGMCVILFPSYLPFILLLGVSLFFLIIRNPFHGYVLFILLLPFWSLSLLQFFGRVDIRPSDLIILIVFLCFLMEGFRNKTLQLQHNPIKIPLILFLSWITLSFLWTQSLIWGLLQWAKILWGVVTFFLTYNLIKDSKRLDLVIVLIIAITLVFALLGISHFFATGTKIIAEFAPEEALRWGEREGGLRAAPFQVHPHKYGAMINYGIILVLSQLVISKSKTTKTLMWFALPIMLMSLFLSFSRTSYIALFVILTVYCLFEKAIRKGLISGFLVIFMLGLVFSPFGRATTERVYQIFYPGEITTIGRPAVYLAGWRIFQENPIGGVGIGSFPLVSPQYGATSLLVAPHNIIIEVLGDYGIIGITLYILLVGAFIKKGLDVYRAVKTQYEKKTLFALFLGLIMYHMMMMVDSYRFGEVQVWVAVGIAISAMNIFTKGVVNEGNGRPSS